MNGWAQCAKFWGNVHKILVMVADVGNENAVASHCLINAAEVRNRIVYMFKKLNRETQIDVCQLRPGPFSSAFEKGCGNFSMVAAPN